MYYSNFILFLSKFNVLPRDKYEKELPGLFVSCIRKFFLTKNLSKLIQIFVISNGYIWRNAYALHNLNYK